MAKYAIGDIQGCYTEFMQLLSKINFNPSVDTLYLVGDVVNRGPQSLQVLEWLYRYQDSIITVLGNHDIFLLGRYAQVVSPNATDTINDILIAPHASKLIDYLRNCPLIFENDKYILAHAGIYPKMDFIYLTAISNHISEILKSANYAKFIEKIYGNKPNSWNETLSPIKQMRFVVNSTTRMRFLDTATFALDYKYKGDLFEHPQNLIPWFKTEMHPSITKKILFGHWAALGFLHTQSFIALDTGCVWGRKLTAINLDTDEIVQISSHKSQNG
ncbi:MAG: symmetrical bis(5'-nucleosyl)-tetraphosphatase [Burkholderiales bacterium]|nr:symmetrical bis(5'-nucleosyl)-tetraphosphatase [Burkholderiales bacterium]